jgi:hypothetical protein
MRIKPVTLVVQNTPLYLLFSLHHDPCACLHYYTYAGLPLGHFHFVLVKTHTGRSWHFLTRVHDACS